MIKFCALFILSLFVCSWVEADINHSQSLDETLGASSFNEQDAKVQLEEYILFDKSRQRTIPITIYNPVNSETESIPVVIINHGYTVKNTEYTFIAKPLTELGYVVVSIQHDLLSDPELPRTGNLFEQRMPIWERGVQNILFVLSELVYTQVHLNLQKIILIGHSNGGDISMLFTSLYPEKVAKAISLDSLRMPIPINDQIPILTLRANDTKADEGVLPNFGVTIIDLLEAKHIDMYDNGPEEVKQKIMVLIDAFLKVNS